MGRFDVCVRLVISIMHVEDQICIFLNDMCCEVGWSGRKKFLVEAVVGPFLWFMDPDRPVLFRC